MANNSNNNNNSNTWLVTFSDFMTLMLVFFVVFYSMTDGIEDSKLTAILNTFQGGRGVLNESSVIPAGSLAERVRQREQRWENLNDYIDEQNLQDQVQLDLMPQGNRIILKESLTFGSGAATLREQSKSVLQEITYLFDQDVAEIEVQGHTDNQPIRSGRYRSNWDLGAERAISVLQFLVANTDIPPEKFKASSVGEFRPLATNETDEGRRANRRVEVLIRYRQSEQNESSSNRPRSNMREELLLPAGRN
ncbi:MAG: OmpA/MotB family protein [Bacteroidota bacterium]